MKNKFRIIISFLLIGLIILHCSESESPSEMETSSLSDTSDREEFSLPSMESGAPMAKRSSGAGENSPAGSKNNYSVKFSPLDPESERLLEYYIDLEFESENFSHTRDKLYEIASGFGFLQSTEENFHQRKTMRASVWVKKQKISDFLNKVNEIGKLRSENIQTNDLTGENYLKQLQLEREKIRSSRRTRGLLTADNKTFVEKERLLSESEEREDQAKFEKWNINDRVSWAKVNIRVIDPNLENRINVPNFTGILHDFVTFFLYAVYFGIYFLPVALIMWLIYKKTTWFRKKEISEK